MIVCSYEDRPAARIGVKLLIASMRRHCPDVTLAVCVPGADDAFRRWCGSYENTRLTEQVPDGARGWNVKPSLLLQMLREGYDEVIWIDSDVALTADFRPLLFGVAPEKLVVSQAQYWDIYQKGHVRTDLWGLEPGRSLPYLISSGFIRITRAHIPLLEAWRELLRHPAYLRAQSRHLYRRPVHMLGDQDVFTALVASKPFAGFPVEFLRRGRDIVLSVGPAGYTLGERLGALTHPLAPLIHCGGTKPWDLTVVPQGNESMGLRYERTYVETSPYAWVAQQYAEELGEPMQGVQAYTWAGKLCRAVTGNHPTLQGVPQAVFHTISRRVKHAMGITAWPTAQANIDDETATNGVMRQNLPLSSPK